MHPNNIKVAKQFEKLADLYEQEGKVHKARAFSTAADTILHLGDEDIAQVYKAKKIPGIGESSKREIEQILATGTSDRIKELTHEIPEEDQRINILEVLTDQMGIDQSDAVRYVISYGITSLSVLRRLIAQEVITEPQIVEGIENVKF